MNAKDTKNYAINPGEETLEQFKECYEYDFVKAAALMPDAHKGYAAPIGAVLVTEGKVVPAWVGYDIGCGVTAVQITIPLEKVNEYKNEIFQQVLKLVPMGVGETNKVSDLTPETKKEFEELLEQFSKGEYDKQVLDFFKNSAPKHLGTLGGGNHFIELGHYEDEVWLIIHSGSRGIGHKVATKYMKKSAKKEKDFEATFPLDVDSQLGKEYLNVLSFGLDFALLNRKEMIRKVIIALEKVFDKKIEYEIWTNKTHNHAIKENEFYIHRKGATPAKEGERGVIPGNMRDGCFLVVGKGNKSFLESTSHGAGRAMSRVQAKEEISMDEFKHDMEGITGTISQKTLDEAPRAYKNIFDVMDAQKDSAEIVKHIVPIINWKG